MTTPVGGNLSGTYADNTLVGVNRTSAYTDKSVVGAKLSTFFSLADQQALNDGFIFDMDRALELKLRGIKVFDKESGGPRINGNHGRPVFVYFANGDFDVQERQWPFITLALIGFNRAANREHRGENFLDDVHYEVGGLLDPSAVHAELDDWAIPYDFTWMVQTHSRNFLHDRQIQLALEMDDKIPSRFGWLQVEDTVRIMTRDSGPTQTDFLTGNPPKRIFRKTYVITATAEFYRSDLLQFSLIQHITLGTIALLP